MNGPAEALACALLITGAFAKLSYQQASSSTICTDAPFGNSPHASTYRDFQGPGEADGSHAAPALSREGDHVVLMDSTLPIRQQQALHLWVLEVSPWERERRGCQCLWSKGGQGS